MRIVREGAVGKVKFNASAVQPNSPTPFFIAWARFNSWLPVRRHEHRAEPRLDQFGVVLAAARVVAAGRANLFFRSRGL